MTRNPARLAAAAWFAAALSACASPTEIPPADTPFLRQKIAEAQALEPAPSDAAPPPHLTAPAPAVRVGTIDPTVGIVDLGAAPVAAFVAKLRDADHRVAETALATTPLDTELVLAAVWVRNPAVAAARADVESARRIYEQASWLEDVESRYRSLGVPAANVRAAMESATLAYPGMTSLRGEMLDREVAMAAARLRMVFLATAAETLGAFHTSVHHEGEVEIRRAQVDVMTRLVDASKARVETGRAPQAELLESQAELAMSRNDLEHALSALDAARRKFNAYLDRNSDAPGGAPFTGADHADPPVAAPDTAALLALARRASPEIAMARAEAARIAVAERMVRRESNPAAAPLTAPSAGAMAADATPMSPGVAPPAWAEELASRRVAAGFRAAEAERNVERMVADMTYELASMARMFRVAKDAAEPAARQALDERLRLYETGRGDFADLLAAAKRHLDARHDIVTALHDYRVMEARLWMAVGARPELANGAPR